MRRPKCPKLHSRPHCSGRNNPLKWCSNYSSEWASPKALSTDVLGRKRGLLVALRASIGHCREWGPGEHFPSAANKRNRRLSYCMTLAALVLVLWTTATSAQGRLWTFSEALKLAI